MAYKAIQNSSLSYLYAFFFFFFYKNVDFQKYTKITSYLPLIIIPWAIQKATPLKICLNNAAFEHFYGKQKYISIVSVTVHGTTLCALRPG